MTLAVAFLGCGDRPDSGRPFYGASVDRYDRNVVGCRNGGEISERMMITLTNDAQNYISFGTMHLATPDPTYGCHFWYVARYAGGSWYWVWRGPRGGLSGPGGRHLFKMQADIDGDYRGKRWRFWIDGTPITTYMSPLTVGPTAGVVQFALFCNSPFRSYGPARWSALKAMTNGGSWKILRNLAVTRRAASPTCLSDCWSTNSGVYGLSIPRSSSGACSASNCNWCC